MQILRWLLVMLFFAAQVAIVQPLYAADIIDKPESKQPFDGKPLQGGVQHSEVLPELIEALRPGNVYSDELLLKSSTAANDLWYHIPSWYAGVRHCDEEVIVYRYDYKTGKTTQPMQHQLNRQNSTGGYQRDRNGGIWDYKHLPLIQHVESDLVNAVLLVKNITPVKESDDQFAIKYEEISISFDKQTNKIVQVVQQEQINTVTCPEAGLMRVDASAKSFGWDGQPLRKEQSIIFSNVIKPFEQVDKLGEVDLKTSFRDFLIANHKEALLPDANK